MVHIYRKITNRSAYHNNIDFKQIYQIDRYKNHHLFLPNHPKLNKDIELIVADQAGETIYNDLSSAMTTNGLPDQTMVGGYKNDTFYIRFAGVTAEGGAGHDNFYIGCNMNYKWLTCPLPNSYHDKHFISSECAYITDYRLHMECEQAIESKYVTFIGNVEWIDSFNQICVYDTSNQPITLAGGGGYNNFYFELNKHCLTEDNFTYWNDQHVIIYEVSRYLPQTNLFYFNTISFKFFENVTAPSKLCDASKLENLRNVIFTRDIKDVDTLHIRFLNEQEHYYGPIISFEKFFSSAIRHEVQIIDQTNLAISLYSLSNILPVIGDIKVDEGL